MKAAVTGHRPNKLGNDYDLTSFAVMKLKEKIRHILVTKKPEVVYIGMALGVDTLCAIVCIEENIPFVAAVPCDNQDRFWPKKSKDLYAYLLSKAAEIVIVSPGPYTRKKMQVRNEWMVNKLDEPGDFLLGVWDNSNGGTANCIHYAMRVHKEIVFLNPQDYV